MGTPPWVPVPKATSIGVHCVFGTRKHTYTDTDIDTDNDNDKDNDNDNFTDDDDAHVDHAFLVQAMQQHCLRPDVSLTAQ